MYVVDEWSTSMLAWYQGVAGWERTARLHDLSDSRAELAEFLSRRRVAWIPPPANARLGV